MYQIQQRDVPEQLMLTEQRNVRPEDLPVWIPAAMTRLIADAAAIGGFVAPPFAVFHGEVNEDSDGPVEVCLPIDPARSAEVTGPNRVEPARREGYTTITKAEVQYPQILSAYEAVYQWLGRNRRTPTGPPRAVYFADFPAASPEDPVCDLAVPMD